MSEPDVLVALRTVVSAFKALHIPYLVGGSVASSAHGTPRSTLDVDLVADIRSDHVRPLVLSLHGTFYIDEEMIHDAIARFSSFNLVHLESMLKLDVFVLKPSPYDQMAFSRLQHLPLVENDKSETFPLSSAEDVVLHKLYWYRSGGEVSERQWGDVLGVLRVQQHKLDLTYLHRWAAELEVSDLLEQALKESES